MVGLPNNKQKANKRHHLFGQCELISITCGFRLNTVLPNGPHRPKTSNGLPVDAIGYRIVHHLDTWTLDRVLDCSIAVGDRSRREVGHGAAQPFSRSSDRAGK